jgi:hypothetical protein
LRRGRRFGSGENCGEQGRADGQGNESGQQVAGKVTHGLGLLYGPAVAAASVMAAKWCGAALFASAKYDTNVATFATDMKTPGFLRENRAQSEFTTR